MGALVGLTGGIASGKSTFSRMLADQGAVVVDADVIARDVVAPGTPGIHAVVGAFGQGICLSDGTLDRPAVARLVFGDEGARVRLNSIVHPLIAAESARRIAAAHADGAPLVVYDAALLVEGGGWRAFGALIVVACDRETQIARLVARERLTRQEAEQRIAAQLPLERKVEVADWVIWNDAGIDALRIKAARLYAALVDGHDAAELKAPGR